MRIRVLSARSGRLTGRVSGCLLGAALVLTAAPLPSAESVSGEEIIARAEARCRSLTDYQCVMDGWAKSGQKTDGGSYRLWFRQPSMLRIKVLKGRDKGSELAVDEDGVVRGRKGGLLKAIVMRLKPTDKRLRSIRGVPITEVPWSCFYRKFHERASMPGARCTLAVRGSGETPHEVTLAYQLDGKKIQESYSIDPESWVMVGGRVVEDGELVDRVQFRDIQLNTGVTDKFFKL